MNKVKTITLVVLLVMLMSIAYAVVFCTPEPKHFILKVTGYCPCEICWGKWADGLTYTGDKAGYGCIAIDPKNGPLKMGQRIYVEGYGYGVCNDIGGAIKGWEADACFDYHWQAVEWGVQLVKIYVIEEVRE